MITSMIVNVECVAIRKFGYVSIIRSILRRVRRYDEAQIRPCRRTRDLDGTLVHDCLLYLLRSRLRLRCYPRQSSRVRLALVSLQSNPHRPSDMGIDDNGDLLCYASDTIYTGKKGK